MFHALLSSQMDFVNQSDSKIRLMTIAILSFK